MTKSTHVGQDLVGSFGPNEGFGGFVVDIEIMPDRLFQFACAAVNAAPESVFPSGEQKAFHQVDPRDPGASH
jgi:hypothetical protein